MSIKCPKCQEKLFLTKGGSRGSFMDKEMVTYTRRRHCSCGYKTNTVELLEPELHELRRKAFLYNLSEARK